MKKLMTLAALVAACAPAFTAEVTSSNTVGYQKITLAANKMDILGQSFKTIGENTTSVQAIDVAGDFSQVGGDWIMVWDDEAETYTRLYYWGASVDGVFTDDTYTTSLGAGWGDPGQIVVDLNVNPGRGFWGNAENGGTIILKGEVPTSGEISAEANKMKLVVNPYPVDTDIQTIGVGGNFSQVGGDWIMVWDSENETYTRLYYWGASVDGVFTDDTYTTSLGAGWGDPGQIVIRHTIPAGHGFWVNAENGGSLVFANPMAPAAPASGED